MSRATGPMVLGLTGNGLSFARLVGYGSEIERALAVHCSEGDRWRASDHESLCFDMVVYFKILTCHMEL